MTISNELLDELLKGCKRPEDLLGDAGLMKELKVRLMERMLGAELTAHLGYGAGAEPPSEQTNRRNGFATKRVKGSDGEVSLSVPRDRDGSFEPELVKKGQTRIDGIDDKIIGLYAAGLSVARHPGPSRGDLRASGVARPDQPRHRCGARRSPGLAAPGAGPNVSDRHFRRSAREDP